MSASAELLELGATRTPFTDSATMDGGMPLGVEVDTGRGEILPLRGKGIDGLGLLVAKPILDPVRDRTLAENSRAW